MRGTVAVDASTVLFHRELNNCGPSRKIPTWTPRMAATACSRRSGIVRQSRGVSVRLSDVVSQHKTNRLKINGVCDGRDRTIGYGFPSSDSSHYIVSKNERWGWVVWHSTTT